MVETVERLMPSARYDAPHPRHPLPQSSALVKDELASCRFFLAMTANHRQQFVPVAVLTPLQLLDQVLHTKIHTKTEKMDPMHLTPENVCDSGMEEIFMQPFVAPCALRFSVCAGWVERTYDLTIEAKHGHTLIHGTRTTSGSMDATETVNLSVTDLHAIRKRVSLVPRG